MAWLGISIYKGLQKQKNKPSPSSAPAEETNEGGLESLFGELLKDPETPEIYSEPESDAVSDPEIDRPSFSSPSEATLSHSEYSYNTIDNQQKLDSIGPEGSPALFKQTPIPTQVNQNLVDEQFGEFDLRKAIIYDAVLNPPYL